MHYVDEQQQIMLKNSLAWFHSSDQYLIVGAHYANGAASPQRQHRCAMPTNPAAMQPSQTGAFEAAEGVFSVAESSAELGAS